MNKEKEPTNTVFSLLNDINNIQHPKSDPTIYQVFRAKATTTATSLSYVKGTTC